MEEMNVLNVTEEVVENVMEATGKTGLIGNPLVRDCAVAGASILVWELGKFGYKKGKAKFKDWRAKKKGYIDAEIVEDKTVMDDKNSK